jgi:Zn-dependent protease with chaperone function
MEAEQLTLLIDRLEVYSREHPTAYRFKVAALAGLGYAYLLGVVLLLLFVVYFVLSLNFSYVTIKIVWIPLVLVGLVLRSLWVTVPKPDGTELSSEHAPKLFELISEVKSALAGPSVDRVLISDEYNAGIVQIPRLGMFGWLRNYLVVGLPLLTALTPQEFRAVLAHEFGHLSGNHGRFSGWIYRMRQSWIQILTRVHEERQYAAVLFEPFLNWYAPFFNAYSFVLARAQEYEADAYSAELAGKETAARALVQITKSETALTEKFWPAFFRKSHDDPQPAKDPFTQMLDGLKSPVDGATEETWLANALKVETGYEDTHPSLKDRLTAMGYDPQSLNSSSAASLIKQRDSNQTTAADYFLETLPEDFVPRCDRLWKEQISNTWREQHALMQKNRVRLTQLDEKHQEGRLTLPERWEHAQCVAEVKDSAAAVPLLRELIDQSPDHAGAHFALGTILLEQRDAAGIELLEKASQLDNSTKGPAYEWIANYLLNQGQREESEQYRARAEEFFDSQRKYMELALDFSYKDHFEPHGLEAGQIVSLRDEIRKIHAVEKAYLVRKIVSGAPEPYLVLGVVAEPENVGLIDQLVATLDIPGPAAFVLLAGKNKFLQPMFESIEGAQIFPAG